MFLPGGQHRTVGLSEAVRQEQIQGRDLGSGASPRLAPVHPPAVPTIIF